MPLIAEEWKTTLSRIIIRVHFVLELNPLRFFCLFVFPLGTSGLNHLQFKSGVQYFECMIPLQNEIDDPEN